MGLRPRLLLGILCATAMLIAAAPASGAVLYDQLNNNGANATVSQDFETSNDAFDNQLADDFVVPGGQSWSVTSVDANGTYFNGPGPAASFNVVFYANSGSNFPGAAVATRTGATFSKAASVFTINLSTPVTLSPGTYWVSVQARQDFTPAGEWGWTDRTVQSNQAAAWQNPGGGFGLPACTSWARKQATCITTASGPDQSFRLNGTSGPSTVYTAQTSTGATITPGTTDIGNHGDDTTTAINFPFPVGFYGQNFNSGNASSNGNLQFTTTAADFTNSCLPGANLGAAIVPYWDDQYLVNSGFGIFTSTTGVAPHRTFNIEWRAQYFPGSGNANYEIKLHEDSPIVTVIYGNTTNGNASATAGVQAAGTGTFFTQFACNGTGGAITNGLRVDYVPDAKTLTVNKPGAGSGTVTSDDGRLNCGSTCSRLFAGGKPVTLTENPAAGSLFTGWSGGGCSGTGTTCTTTMDADKAVTANFAVARTLTVAKGGSGGGSVSSSPGGIDCGATCSSQYSDGSAVTLTATADGSSSFTGWSGGGCSGTGDCTTTMSSDQSVTANFAAHRTLTVGKSGSGAGSVTSSPGGIDCGATCSASYDDGTAVTLTATAGAGSAFAGWSGGGCSGTGTCAVTMGSDQSVSAAFDVVANPGPPNTKIKKAKINQAKHKATFKFGVIAKRKSGAAATSGFQCQLKKKGKKAKPFKNCKSPKTYKHLKPGKYLFKVRAFSAAGKDPTPAKKKFKIKR